MQANSDFYVLFIKQNEEHTKSLTVDFRVGIYFIVGGKQFSS